MPGSYIVAGARTPIGKMSGALADFSAADLGGLAIAEALRRAGVQPAEVDHVIVGQVLMAGQGQVPSRQAAVKAGVPMSIPSININKVCLSGLNAIYLADQMIASGEADIVVAAGMESMTNAPYLAAGARSGFRYGNTELADAIIEQKGLRQITDTGAIEAAIDEVMARNPGQLADYRSGKDKLFGFFVGQVMKATGGKANPAQLNELLKAKLAG